MLNLHIQQYLANCHLDKGFQGYRVMNPALSSLYGGPLEITFTVPLIVLLFLIKWSTGCPKNHGNSVTNWISSLL